MKSMRLSNLLVALASLAISALLAEGAFRAVVDDGMTYEIEMWKYAKYVKVRSSDPNIGHQHRANARASLMGVDVRTDLHGFRGEDIPLVPPPDVARIAFVGDSITLGWGVSEQETFARRVLADLQSYGRKVDGFNAGVGNYNTTQELGLFRTVGLQMHPDIVVLVYFINDAEPIPAYNTQSWLDWNSAAWTVLAYRGDSLLRKQGSRMDWKNYYRDLYRDKEAGWEATKQAVRQFAELVKNSGAQLIIFNIPELRELRPYPFPDVTAKVEALARASNIAFVDLLPAVEAQEPSSLWVTVPDPHPNGKANGLFSEVMVREMIPMLDRLCEAKNKGCSAP